MLVTDTIQNYNKEDGIYTYKNNIMDFMLVDNTYYQYITSDINSLNNFLKLNEYYQIIIVENLKNILKDLSSFTSYLLSNPNCDCKFKLIYAFTFIHKFTDTQTKTFEKSINNLLSLIKETQINEHITKENYSYVLKKNFKFVTYNNYTNIYYRNSWVVTKCTFEEIYLNINKKLEEIKKYSDKSDTILVKHNCPYKEISTRMFKTSDVFLIKNTNKYNVKIGCQELTLEDLHYVATKLDLI